MEKLIIEGGYPLNGEVLISGAKNAALPIMAASLLTDEPCIIRNFPVLRDTQTMMKLLRSLGKVVKLNGHVLTITSSDKINDFADYALVSTMRGSFCVLGPLLAKLGRARVSLPGGCVIGVRPVDLHLKGLKQLNAKIEIENGYVIATAKQLKGSHIYLGGIFGPSVLATANVMMAATLAKGETIIEPAACEPEIEDLANCLVSMGARLRGQGSPTLYIDGVKKLHGFDYTLIPDRIEAGTFLLMGAATNSSLTVKGAYYPHMLAVIDKLRETGNKVVCEDDAITVIPSKNRRPTTLTTFPYPGFPTDLQAQFMVYMALTEGISVITDKVYPDRFIHIAELNRMGADIRREGMSAIIRGVKVLHGAPVMASDLRASAALIIAGLAADGKTEVHRIYHLDRGYEALDQKLLNIGAKVYREKG